MRELLSSSNLAKTFKVDDRGLDLFSEFGDILSKNLVEQMVKEHISPIREYLAKQNIDSEYGEASKLEGFQEALPKIQQILQQYGNQISFHDAYKLARFDELTANQKKAVEQAMGGEEEIEGAEKLQRAKAGERPSGRGTDGVSLKKPKNRSEARGNAARKLASMGVDVTGE